MSLSVYDTEINRCVLRTCKDSIGEKQKKKSHPAICSVSGLIALYHFDGNRKIEKKQFFGRTISVYYIN